MAARTHMQVRSVGTEKRTPMPVAVSTIIYEGDKVCLNADGFAVPAADTSGYLPVQGIALETVDNSAGQNGDLTVVVRSGLAIKEPMVSITAAMAGDKMYATAAQTSDDVGGVSNNIVSGVLEEFISTTSGWLWIPVGGCLGL